MTLVEKILSNHVGRSVKQGEFVLAKIDATMSHDANRPLAVDAFNDMGGTTLFNPDRVVMALEHNYPLCQTPILYPIKKYEHFAESKNACFMRVRASGIPS